MEEEDHYENLIWWVKKVVNDKGLTSKEKARILRVRVL